MLEKENQECHCSENCVCKSNNEVNSKSIASCECEDKNKLDHMMEYDGSCNCGCECDCTDESCNCGCEDESSECEDHSCGCDEQHHEHK